ncbi:hypothetical protein J6590_002020 [Homalodisca vitripennis]|nr:hypothetical protein J6590_002020 [Homalodisca vitripennis]
MALNYHGRILSEAALLTILSTASRKHRDRGPSSRILGPKQESELVAPGWWVDDVIILARPGHSWLGIVALIHIPASAGAFAAAFSAKPSSGLQPWTIYLLARPKSIPLLTLVSNVGGNRIEDEEEEKDDTIDGNLCATPKQADTRQNRTDM